ncbi:hypothetical protein ORJ66_18330 [Pseudoalteromonas tunicata]|uniref:hypothetical protein n=1 Tax=Pseudoalteromonas tunicata TaxID=314281 RepID=UPI00273FBE44|nr:hypothetical protein [Pseudoalteromonas tunicata]MDP5215014.1 hypothetical protein [Pseudoalteromonas tunicata]
MKNTIAFIGLLIGAYYLGYTSNTSAVNFSHVATKAASQEQLLDLVIAKTDSLCYEKAGMSDDNFTYTSCIRRARDFSKMCKSKISRDMPAQVSNPEEAKRFSLRMINCLVPIS